MSGYAKYSYSNGASYEGLLKQYKYGGKKCSHMSMVIFIGKIFYAKQKQNLMNEVLKQYQQMKNHLFLLQESYNLTQNVQQKKDFLKNDRIFKEHDKQEHDKQDEIVRTVFTYNTCARVMHFKKEQDVLIQFELFMKAFDPNIVIGYNIQNFDLPYLLNRAAF